MTKLHEVLAVDRDKEKQAKAITGETLKMWMKPMYFSAMHKSLEMFDDDRQKEAEAFKEKNEMTTTVPERIGYTLSFLIDHLDILFQKELTNQKTSAPIVVDDSVLIENVPATMLLALERELGKYKQIFLKIPTLDSSIEWAIDEDAGQNIYKAVHEIKAHKTEKTMKVISLAKPTPQHKEQVTTVNQDSVVGQYKTKKWSGMITSARKAEILKHFDNLISGVKQARMRANEEEVIQGKIGEQLFKYIFG